MQQQQPYLQQQQMQPQSQPQYTTNTAATTATPFNMPVKPTTTNPFPRTQGHMSQQSVDINAFQNGRHSPDAFASLSARYS
jgi:hypothetical protein